MEKNEIKIDQAKYILCRVFSEKGCIEDLIKRRIVEANSSRAIFDKNHAKGL